MKLNEYGNIAKKTWTDLPAHFATCQLDEFVIMPNHLHGIIRFADAGVGNRHACSLQCKRQHQQLAVVIGSYKSAVSKYICQNGIKKFKWQKSYYDRIIRSNGEINRIREYIRNNPQNWNADQENPVN
jgi:REP element-mobilizing transposase RayT